MPSDDGVISRVVEDFAITAGPDRLRSMKRVLVVGEINVDLVLQGPTPSRSRARKSSSTTWS
jgi:hypothetical protein